MKFTKNHENVRNLVEFAILFALVILLQLFGSVIKIGATSISLVLIPIVIGGILLGPFAGAFLGFTFGFITLMAGVTGTDVFTFILLNEHPVITTLLCLGKGTLAGFIPAVVYALVKRHNELIATFVAAALAPIVNTGLFITVGLLFLKESLQNNFVDGTSVAYFLIIGCAGINFLLELGVNVIFAPAISRVIKAITRRR